MSNVDGDVSITPAGRTAFELSSVTPPTATTTTTTTTTIKKEIRFTTLTILQVVRPTLSPIIPTGRRNQISVPPANVPAARSSTSSLSPTSVVLSSPLSLIPTTTPSSVTPTSTTIPTTLITPLAGPSMDAIPSLSPSSKMAIVVVGAVATLVVYSSDNAEKAVEGITPFPYSERNPRPESVYSTSSRANNAQPAVPNSPTSVHAHHGSVSSEMLAIERSNASSLNGFRERIKRKRSICKSLKSMRVSVSSRLGGTSDGQSHPSSFGSGISTLIASLSSNRP
ncbi:hypothetical protein CCMSSC00406_0003958 [Pleurotus cornucopiae]|uniref:Uncharacterized protein n=1 Tax=Pleurotus cornucopiae TaxID=5321 RepID=A0ACB7IQL5_PLECO|nr:hypothetical protein CCMSSC00406_0003958 [Pleurotus cornucopiae]